MDVVTVKEIEYIVFSIARERFSYNEPIPDFATRFPNSLESCLSVPFQIFGGRDLYPTFIKKASILFYLMIKNHPFQNGNKRIAMVSLFYVLYRNDKWLRVDTKTLYNFAMWVTSSLPINKEETVQAIEKFIGRYMVSWGNNSQP